MVFWVWSQRCDDENSQDAWLHWDPKQSFCWLNSELIYIVQSIDFWFSFHFFIHLLANSLHVHLHLRSWLFGYLDCSCTFCVHILLDLKSCHFVCTSFLIWSHVICCGLVCGKETLQVCSFSLRFLFYIYVSSDLVELYCFASFGVDVFLCLLNVSHCQSFDCFVVTSIHVLIKLTQSWLLFWVEGHYSLATSTFSVVVLMLSLYI